MKKRILIGVLFVLMLTWAFAIPVSDETLDQIKKQLIAKDDLFGERFPETTLNGEWQMKDKINWLSGFLGGELWYLYEMTGDKALKTRALAEADQMIAFAGIDNTHDMGFIFLPTCVKAWQMTGDPKYRSAGILAANMLAKRFHSNGKFIQAWGKLNDPEKGGWMIIDTMMNLELLFWSAQETGDLEFYRIAYKHALTTLRESVRADGSSYHVIEFDQQTGKVVKKRTHQGVGDETTWARGQAWGIYGFANAYKFTGDERFLKAAQRMADYFIASLPKDGVPFFDFSLEGKDIPRDASAAAIAASGMFLLSEQVKTETLETKYASTAEKMVASLRRKYLFKKSRRPVEQGLLLHTVYNFAKNLGVDESFPCGDYYFIEALYKSWKNEQLRHLIKPEPVRQTINLNANWYYLEDNSPTIAGLSKTIHEWQKINLPHTWNAFDVVDAKPGYRRDAGWYKKQLFISKEPANMNYLLYFEGVNITSQVFVNGKPAGGHVGGYIGFGIDITPFVEKGKFNEILVWADNSVNFDVIPSQKSDFFIYGGITRDVWLKVVPPVYLQGAQIRTPKVSKESATTSVQIQLVSTIQQSEKMIVEAVTIDAKGKQIAKQQMQKVIEAGASGIALEMPVVKKPELWSPDAPNLYSLVINLKRRDKILDTISEKFGYRWFEFKEHGPFYLNGERLLLRGTHRHEEWAGLGNALPDSLHRKDMQMIKEIGANFVRLAHYPQDPEVYRACDELGLLVWDETPWCRGGMGGEVWKANTLRMEREIITQNINHPSIIIWSLGNELDWLPDFPNGDQPDSLKQFIKTMHELAHRIDPGRVTATRKFYNGEGIVDVFSPSIWAGWYSGVYTNYEQAITKSRDEYKRFFHAEYGGDSHVGRHTETPISGQGLIASGGWEESAVQTQVQNIAQNGDCSENYIVDLFDWHLHLSEKLDWFTGNAQWIFKDFGTPLRPENPIPYVNQKGLVTRDGKPKDAWYVFKSYWTKTPKFCYIESHTWTERSGPKGALREVCVFSNCNEVELFLNDVSQGIRTRVLGQIPAQGLKWDVQFAEGKNDLIAKGFFGEKPVATDSLRLNYTTKKAGKPEDIRLSSEELPNGNFLIVATVVDKKGQRCLDYNRRVYFSSDGSGKLVDEIGTPTGSRIIEFASGRAAIEFVPVPGERAVIEARNQDFKCAYLTIEE